MSLRVIGLDEIREEAAAEVGGKALGLARLAALGLPVPPGFVVTASFFGEIRARAPVEPEIEGLARRLPAALRGEIEAALDALGQAPDGYAVRSSSAEEDGVRASFAGIHESFLRVPREQVVPTLFRCWASAFCERALLYRRRAGLPVDTSLIRMAVMVQPMLQPSSAGVLFTSDPASPTDDLLINAVTGSAEKLAQGRVEPRIIRVPRRREGGWRGPRNGDPLSTRDLEELVSLALRAEAAWKSPLDIEWALEKDHLYLLQARPVTAPLPRPEASPTADRGSAPVDDTLWTRANLRELLPDLPSPLFLSMMERIDWVEVNRRLGIALDPGSEVFRLIEGRPYFNLTLIERIGSRFGFPLSRFARAFGHGADLAGVPETAFRPLLVFLSHPGVALPLLRIQSSLRRKALGFFDRGHAGARRFRAEDPGLASDARLAEILREADAHNLELLHFLQVAFLRVASNMIKVEMLLPSRVDADRFISAAVAAGEKNISVRQGLDLLLLARLARSEGRVVQYLLEGKETYRGYEAELEGTRFLPAFREYLAAYGHRGIHESDPAMPLYLEAPGFLLKAIGAVAADPRSPDPEATLKMQEETAASAWRDLSRKIGFLGRIVPIRLSLIRHATRSLKKAMALRERIRFEGMRLSAESRRFLREAGRRFAGRGILDQAADLPFLRIEEIEAVLTGKEDGKGLGETVGRRKKEMEGRRLIPMPNLLRESEISRLRERHLDPVQEREVFRGLPVGPGKVEGKVVILEGPHEMDRVRKGDILVTPTLDPSWIPLFTLASGLVVEMGGTLSHGSIIAREYGLPAVVNIPGITRFLKTGDRVLVDGSAGLVRRLAAASPPHR